MNASSELFFSHEKKNGSEDLDGFQQGNNTNKQKEQNK